MRQAQHLAKALNIPFGYLFLSTPPQDALPIPDLRTLPGTTRTAPSADLRETVLLALQRQSWYIEHLRDQGHGPLTFVGRFGVEAPPEKVAADMHEELAIDLNQMHPSKDSFLTHLVQAAERIGILVMRSGIAGNNTHRPLDVSDFRGFAISDPLAPLVFINSADAPSARVFTLVHELAHIWLGNSGVSSATPGSAHRAEVFCNAVAGEFLVPRERFLSVWQSDTDPELQSKVHRVSDRFHVSRLVVMRRALDLGLIGRDLYQQDYLTELQVFRERPGAGGGSFYRNAVAKNSRNFSRAVVAETLSGRMLLRDAGHLLGISPAKLQQYAAQISE